MKKQLRTPITLLSYSLKPKLWILLILFCVGGTTGLHGQLSYNIDDVDGQTLYLPSIDGSIRIYDSGGPQSSYTNNEEYQVTICSDIWLAGCPPPPTLNAIFNYVDIEPEFSCGYDGLYANSYGPYCNDNYPPFYGTNVASSIESTDGCITLYFYSDGSIVNGGFQVEFVADYTPFQNFPLECGNEFSGYIGLAFEGCVTCEEYYECGGTEYGPYYGIEEKYNIEATGLTTLSIVGNVDFFVYGLTTNIGPNGCPPISSIACATGNQTSVTFNADDYPYGIWVIIDALYDEPYSLSMNCGYGCNPCDLCFTFLPRYGSLSTVDFQSQYCGDDPIPTSPDRENTLSYQWDVLNVNEQYTSGTNSASINPSIIFPGHGTYTVCQYVYQGGNLVYECCRKVVIGTCQGPPVAHYTAQLGVFDRYVLNAGNAQGQVHWTFSDPDVFFFQGDEYSTQPVIVIPYETCVTVCLSVTNACGISTFCMELCLDHPTCPGTTPPVYLTNPVTPVVDGQTIEIDLPNPSGAMGEVTYQWDFGDGTTATTQDVVHQFPEYGTYHVCVIITAGCRTWCYCWCIYLNPCLPEYTYNDGQLDFEFTGSETQLQYVFTSQVPKAPGEDWLIDGDPVGGGSNNLTYTFPQAGNYVICFPYIGFDQCVYYYCIEIYVGNPFACTNITWRFDAESGYQFILPATSTDIQWTVDETGQSLGSGLNSQWILPISPCGWRTISVRYFDGIRYRICCLRIYLCPPDECFGAIDFGFLSESNQATFKLNSPGATELTWFFDDTPQQVLGTTTQIQIPYPGTCQSRWISVRYKDSFGRWRICCRWIYFCNPVACDLIRIHYSEQNGYSFSTDQPQESMSWIIEETGTALGTGQTSQYFPAGSNCGYRTVSLRYWLPGFGWKLCCLRFYWCNPNLCGDQIRFRSQNQLIVLEAPDHLQQLTWYSGAEVLGHNNPIVTNYSTATGRHFCLRYYDPCLDTWQWCCRTYTPGGSSQQLTFNLADRVCGASGQIVEVELKASGFQQLLNFQFSVQLADSTLGKIIEVVPENLSGTFEAFVSNGMTASVIWENATAQTLPDETTIARIRIRMHGTVPGETAISITDTPIPFYAEDALGNQVTAIRRPGSICYERLVDICGRITRDDQVPIANVTVSLNGCRRFTTITDIQGNYCFRDVPEGSSYVVQANKDLNYKNGVNAGDLSAIRRHILSIQRLNTPYRILAADAKQSAAVNSGDVSELRRLILNQILDLPTCESWEFTDKTYVFPNPQDPLSVSWPREIVLQQVNADVSNADFIGWKMGDVNVSNNPQNFTGDQPMDFRSQSDIFLHASSVHIPYMDTVRIDITANQFSQILAGQFSIRYDQQLLSFQSISSYHPMLDLGEDNFHHIDSIGRIGFIWDAANAVSLPDGARLFSLKFLPRSQPILMSAIEFVQDPVSFYFENDQGEELNVITSVGQVTVPVNELADEHVMVSPNPTTGMVNVQVVMESAEAIHIQLLNELGSVVFHERKAVADPKAFATGIDLSHLPPGVYFVRIRTSAGQVTERIVRL